jgi:hypothetical protein
MDSQRTESIPFPNVICYAEPRVKVRGAVEEGTIRHSVLVPLSTSCPIRALTSVDNKLSHKHCLSTSEPYSARTEK